MKNNRVSPWYNYVEMTELYENHEAIWSRTRCYSWREAHDRAIQWAHFFLSKGVKPGDLVATYLMNSAEFLVLWLGLWCIGCAPAMLNFNLKGEAMIHCLKVCEAKLLIVDEEPECRERFEEVRSAVENELGVEAHYLDTEFERHIATFSTTDPGDSYRENVKGEDPSGLLYTRLVVFSLPLVESTSILFSERLLTRE